MAYRVPYSVNVSNTTLRFLSPCSRTNIDRPPMPYKGLHTALPCSRRNSLMSCMSRVMRVGAQHSGNQAVYTFVHVPQTLRPVAHQRTLVQCAIQNVRGVDILRIEGRILARQNHVEFTQVCVLRLASHKPCSGVVEYLQRRQTSPGDAVAQPKML